MADENEIRRRVERYERTLLLLAVMKRGERLTADDHRRAVEVAEMVGRYEDEVRGVKAARSAPEPLAPRTARAPVRKRRRRKRVAQPAAPAATRPKRGRPRKLTPPEGDLPGS